MVEIIWKWLNDLLNNEWIDRLYNIIGLSMVGNVLIFE